MSDSEAIRNWIERWPHVSIPSAALSRANVHGYGDLADARLLESCPNEQFEWFFLLVAAAMEK